MRACSGVPTVAWGDAVKAVGNGSVSLWTRISIRASCSSGLYGPRDRAGRGGRPVRRHAFDYAGYATDRGGTGQVTSATSAERATASGRPRRGSGGLGARRGSKACSLPVLASEGCGAENVLPSASRAAPRFTTTAWRRSPVPPRAWSSRCSRQQLRVPTPLPPRAGRSQPTVYVVNNLTPEAGLNPLRRAGASYPRIPDRHDSRGFSGGDEPDGSAKFITAFFRAPVREVTEAGRLCANKVCPGKAPWTRWAPLPATTSAKRCV